MRSGWFRTPDGRGAVLLVPPPGTKKIGQMKTSWNIAIGNGRIKHMDR